MEHPRLQEHGDTPRPSRRAGKAVLLWLFIVVACALYGFWDPGGSRQPEGEVFDIHMALEGMICVAALGAGVATCISTACLLLGKVRAGRISKLCAVVVLLSVAVFVSSPLTFFLMTAAQAVRPWHILQQDMAFLTIAGVSWWTLEASLATFLLFCMLIIFTRKEQR